MSDKNGLPTGKHTLVEEGTEFKGTLTSSCPIVVVGKVDGDISGPVIHIAATGSVAGRVKVKELHSKGVLAGEVDAETVQIAGTVRDKTVIRAKALDVSLSSKSGMEVTFGECELAIGDEPQKAAAIAEALAQPKATAASAPPEEKAEPKIDTKGDEGGKRRQGGTQPPPLS